MFPFVLLGLGAALLAMSGGESKSPSTPTPPSGGAGPLPPTPPAPPIPGAGTDAGGLWQQISQGIGQGSQQAGKAITDFFSPGTQAGLPAPGAPTAPGSTGVLAPSKWDACFDANMTDANKAMARTMLDQAEAAAKAANPLITDYFLRTADAFASDFPLFSECLKRVASNIEVVE